MIRLSFTLGIISVPYTELNEKFTIHMSFYCILNENIYKFKSDAYLVYSVNFLLNF